MSSTTSHVTRCYARCCSAKGRKIDDEQLAEWKRILQRFDPGLLDIATTERLSQGNWYMDAGDLAETCRILQAGATSGPQELEHWRRDTYRCHKCLDTGWRTVWMPAAMSAALRHVIGKLDERSLRGHLTDCVVLCPCGAGGGRKRKLRRNGEPVEHLELREDMMVECDRSQHIGDRIEALLSWARDWKPANYVREFEQF